MKRGPTIGWAVAVIAIILFVVQSWIWWPKAKEAAYNQGKAECEPKVHFTEPQLVEDTLGGLTFVYDIYLTYNDGTVDTLTVRR